MREEDRLEDQDNQPRTAAMQGGPKRMPPSPVPRGMGAAPVERGKFERGEDEDEGACDREERQGVPLLLHKFVQLVQSDDDEGQGDKNPDLPPGGARQESFHDVHDTTSGCRREGKQNKFILPKANLFDMIWLSPVIFIFCGIQH